MDHSFRYEMILDTNNSSLKHGFTSCEGFKKSCQHKAASLNTKMRVCVYVSGLSLAILSKSPDGSAICTRKSQKHEA